MNNYAQICYSPILPITLGALPAALVTALLVLLMQSLIANDLIPIDEERVIIAPLVRPDLPLPVSIRDKAPVRPDDPIRPPEQHVTRNTIHPKGGEQTWTFEAPLPKDDTGIEIGVGGGGIVAYLRPQPVYPTRPLTKGIEGHVDLAFDIAVTGSTANIRVIDAQPQGVFERAAINALKKWKYKVPVIDGVPRGQVDMMTRITFKLQE